MATTTRLEITMAATPRSIRRLRDQVSHVAQQVGAAARVVEDVRLCVSEAVTNVVRHAYDSDMGRVAVRVESSDALLRVVVRDAGRGMTGRRGRDGLGLWIIDSLAERYVVSSAPRLGTEVSMSFSLQNGGVLHGGNRVPP
jgi:serine/threonine-protein kinase RsbW